MERERKVSPKIKNARGERERERERETNSICR